MKLSKREAVLLTFLLVIGLVFVEFRFLLTPAINNMVTLSEEYSDLQFEYQTINNNLTLAKAMEKTRDENLIKIKELSQPFLDGVAPDALLVFTHEMMLKHGFTLDSYSPSPLSSQLLQPEQAEISALTYRIKEIAVEYRNLSQPVSEEPAEQGGQDQPESTNDVVELYQLNIFALGSYDQIKTMLDDFDSLAKWIIITNINMTPDQADPTLLYIEFWINYYGIEKLEPETESINDWLREPFPASTDNPFGPALSPAPEPTPAETTATGG
jgi:Tfp pilus assembly protein PilO